MRHFLCTSFIWCLSIVGLSFFFKHPPESKLHNIVLIKENSKTPILIDPYYHRQNTKPQILTFQAFLDLNEERIVRVKADDCVREILIDNKEIYSGKCSICLHCKGAEFYIPDTVDLGSHIITFKIENMQGNTFFEYLPSLGIGWLISLCTILVGCGILYLSFFVGFRKSHCLIALVSLAFALAYFAITSYSMRGFDIPGHVEYINEIVKKQRIPGFAEMWQSYHPPLYYLCASFWGFIVQLLPGDPIGGEGLLRSVQSFSFICYLLTILVTANLLQQVERKKKIHALTSLLFFLLPAYVFFIGRINNDILLPLIGSTALLFLLKYEESSRIQTAFILGILSAAAVATKLNGITLWLGTILFMIWKKESKDFLHKQQIHHLLAAFMPGFLVLVIWMIRSYEQTGFLLYSNAKPLLSTDLKIDINAYTFFSFDVTSFLTQISADPFGGKIRESFLTFLSATLLNSEEYYPSNFAFIIFSLRAAFIPVLIWLIVAWHQIFKNLHDPLFRACVILFTLQFLFLILLVIKQPLSCSMDARYLAPAFLPFSFLMTWKMTEEGSLQKLFADVWLIVLSFLLGSFHLFILIFNSAG